MSYFVSQREANENLKELMAENKAQSERVNHMMQVRYLGCDVNEGTLTAEFPVLPWELNRRGKLHGGVICTMLDHVAGITEAILTGVWGPTANMSVSFMRMASLGDTVVCTGKVEKVGRRLIYVSGILKDGATGKAIATCQAAYINNAE